MFEFHQDLERYFNMQYWTSKEYIIPFLKQCNVPWEGKRVLELGCAEAGVLKAFVEEGSECMGIDMDSQRVENAKKLQAEAVQKGQLSFSTKNVYDIDIQKDLKGGFDIIILKDVIEHIPQQEKFIPLLKKFLNPKGVIFFGFPPWQMPFGGHQQILAHKTLSKLPWIHLLPNFVYGPLVKYFTNEESRAGMLEIKSTGISIERFESIIKKSDLQVIGRTFFLFNPIYKYKFGLEVKTIPKLLSQIPFFRNFYTTGVYYIVA